MTCYNTEVKSSDKKYSRNIRKASTMHGMVKTETDAALGSGRAASWAPARGRPGAADPRRRQRAARRGRLRPPARAGRRRPRPRGAGDDLPALVDEAGARHRRDEPRQGRCRAAGDRRPACRSRSVLSRDDDEHVRRRSRASSSASSPRCAATPSSGASFASHCSPRCAIRCVTRSRACSATTTPTSTCASISRPRSSSYRTLIDDRPVDPDDLAHRLCALVLGSVATG